MIVGLLFLAWSILTAGDYPYCTDVIYDASNRINIQAMLYNCSNNIQGALLPPSTFSPDENNYSPTVVNITVAINSLIRVDDLTTQVTLDCWLRQYWEDPRINLPSKFWSSMNPAVYRQGIEISPYIRNDDPLNFWLPDTYIIEVVEMNAVSELIHLFPNRSLFWSRHLLVTLIQPSMDLHSYPDDTQQFSMSFQSFAYSTDFVVLSFIQPVGAVALTKDSTGEYYVSLNQICKSISLLLLLHSVFTFHISGSYQSYSATVVTDSAPIFFNPSRQFSTVVVLLNFARQSFGVIFRLALPITIFLFIVGFSFWAEEDKRIDITVNMLLVISALYLVIGQVIPFVGYYTTLDLYITTAFMLLAVTCGCHFLVLQFNRKKDKYPLLDIFQYGLVFFFRLVWLPMAVAMFVIFFGLDQSFIIAPFVLVIIASVVNAIYHYPTLRKVYVNSLNNLLTKQEKTDEKLSTFEGIVTGQKGGNGVEMSPMHSNSDLNKIVKEEFQSRISQRVPKVIPDDSRRSLEAFNVDSDDENEKD